MKIVDLKKTHKNKIINYISEKLEFEKETTSLTYRDRIYARLKFYINPKTDPQLVTKEFILRSEQVMDMSEIKMRKYLAEEFLEILEEMIQKGLVRTDKFIVTGYNKYGLPEGYNQGEVIMDKNLIGLREAKNA